MFCFTERLWLLLLLVLLLLLLLMLLPQLSPSSSPYFNTQSLLEVIVGSPSLLLVRHWVQDGSRHRVGTRTIILCADPVGGRSC